ncbi:MAG TPA: HEAT repeat domain-containing protein [Planctomycetota bacterium]|jgi:HEAT repeat protein
MNREWRNKVTNAGAWRAESSAMLAFLLAGLNDESWAVRQTSEQLLNKAFKQWAATDQARNIAASLKQRLNDTDVRIRGIAIEGLGRMREPDNVPALLPSLADPHPTVRGLAINALRDIGDKSVMKQLVELLADPYETVRGLAERALSDLNPYWQSSGAARAAAFVLIERLRGDSLFDPGLARGALLKIGAPAFSLLAENLVHPNYSLRTTAWELLGKLDPEWPRTEPVRKMVPAFIERLGHTDSGLRLTAATVLGLIRDDQAGPALISRLNDDIADVRAACAISLGQLKCSAAIEPLIARLDDNEQNLERSSTAPPLMTSVRVAAATALGALKAQAAVQPLMQALDGPFPAVRAAAAEALGLIGDPQAIRTLIEHMVDDSAAVRMNACRAAAAISRQWFESPEAHAAVPKLCLALTALDSETRAEAAVALGQIADCAACGPLLGQIKNREPMVRRKIVRALGQIGDAQAIDKLIDCLDDPDDEVRLDARVALTRIRDANEKWQYLHPNLYCPKCNRRSVEHHAKLGLVQSERYVGCRECRSSNSLIKAEQVIGFIGGKNPKGEDCWCSKKTVYVRLWDEDAKQACFADIDALEVRDAPGTSYVHAINAVVNAFDFGGKPLKGETPASVAASAPLPPGATKMLREHFRVDRLDIL